MLKGQTRASSRLTKPILVVDQDESLPPKKAAILGRSRLNDHSETLESEKKFVNKRNFLNKKYFIQTWIFLAITIILGLIFLTLIFPQLVHQTGIINSKKYVAPENQIKPQMPIFNAPPNHTSEAQLLITGFSRADTKIQFIIDEQILPENIVLAGLNGEFSFNWSLQEGENTLSAYAIDKEGLESDRTKNYIVNFDQTSPEINLIEPRDGQEIVGKDKNNITFKGETESLAKVIINNRQTQADSEGKFELNYLLNEGENIFKIIALDKAENKNELEVKIHFKP